MADDEIHQPNDKLFSATFRVPANTAALLRAEFPPAVAALVDWDRIQLLPGSFVDSQYRRSHTDLLFSAPISGRSGLIYVLFEHQSTPDRRLPLRLLRYLTRIWETHAGEHPATERLPVILPVVLSQNAEAWDIPTRLSGLLDVPESAAEDLRPFIPDFSFHDLQLAGMAFEAIPGTASGVLVLRAMKAERLGRLLDEAVWDDELIVSVPPEVFHLVLRYILGADIDKEAFETRLHSISDPEIRTTAMTLAQRYHQEGRQEGRQEGILKGRREDVLEALSIRFDHVPEGLREAVLAVADEESLRNLLRAAIRCESVEAFAKGL
jgi:hypothetical protein